MGEKRKKFNVLNRIFRRLRRYLRRRSARSFKVSVIIPVYRPGDGFTRCIDSLRRQKLEEIEMIFVDDRGEDGSMEILRRVARRDPRIRILTNPKNLGAGASRNAGIEAARGEYLSFVDADDYVSRDFLQRLYRKAKAEDLDIVKGGVFHVEEDGSVVDSLFSRQNRVMREQMKGRDVSIGLVFTYSHWAAVYRHSLFDDSSVRYGLTSKGEDTTFLLRIGHAARSLGFDDGAVYYYVHRMDSATHTFSPESLEDQRRSVRDKVDLISEVYSDPEDDRADAYIRGLIRYQLMTQRRAAAIAGLEEPAARLLAGLREQVLRLPAVDIHRARHAEIRALTDCGENLTTQLPPDPEQRLEAEKDLLDRWDRFMRAHPECAEQDVYRKPFARVLKDGEKTALKIEKEVSAEAAESFRERIRAAEEWLDRACGTQ